MGDVIYKRVKKGEALLEKEFGFNWFRHIDLAELDLSSCKQCILGQLFGDYGSKQDSLGFDPAESERHGFTVTQRNLATKEFDYWPLTQAWARLILRRLGKRFTHQ